MRYLRGFWYSLAENFNLRTQALEDLRCSYVGKDEPSVRLRTYKMSQTDDKREISVQVDRMLELSERTMSNSDLKCSPSIVLRWWC